MGSNKSRRAGKASSVVAVVESVAIDASEVGGFELDSDVVESTIEMAAAGAAESEVGVIGDAAMPIAEIAFNGIAAELTTEALVAKNDAMLARAEAEGTVADNSGPVVVKDIPKSRAAGVAKSWENAETRRRRQEKHAVLAGKPGEEKVKYNSLCTAFKELDRAPGTRGQFPASKHIGFRILLKQAGNLSFAGHDFEVVYD